MMSETRRRINRRRRKKRKALRRSKMIRKRVETVAELSDRALLWWPVDVRAKAVAASFKDAMLATFSIFKKTLRDAKDLDSLIEKVTELNKNGELPANIFLRHCMLFTNLGWEAIMKWFGDTYDVMFPGQKFEAGDVQFGMPKVTKAGVRISSAHIQQSYTYELPTDKLEQILACIKLLFMGSHSSWIQLERCYLSIYFDDEDGGLFLDDAATKYIEVSKQTSGAESAGSGSILETMVAIEPIKEYLKSHFPELVFVTKRRDPKIADGMVSDQWFINEENNHAVAVEVSFQETTNSTFSRKTKDAENRKNLFTSNLKSAFVIDGVGSLEHRKQECGSIISHADIVVSAREDEIERLADYIGEWLTG